MSSGQNGGTVSVNFVLGEDKIGDLSRLSLAPCTHNPEQGQSRESNHRVRESSSFKVCTTELRAIKNNDEKLAIYYYNS